eukprot:1155362-Pelagomonas_calceolata.AAC.2
MLFLRSSELETNKHKSVLVFFQQWAAEESLWLAVSRFGWILFAPVICYLRMCDPTVERNQRAPCPALSAL